MATCAAYNPESVERVRAWANQGRGLTGIARSLGWTCEFAERIARRHRIELIDDRQRASAEPTIPPPPSAPQRKPVIRRNLIEEPAKPKPLRKAHPRTRNATIAISEAAEAALHELAREHGYDHARVRGAGSLLAITVDYALRHDNLVPLIEAALSEQTTMETAA